MKPAAPHADLIAVRSFAAARAICKREAPDLFFASAFLPTAKRNAVYAVFAFSQMIRQVIPPHNPNENGVASPATTGSSCCSTHTLDQTVTLVQQRLDEIYAQRLDLPLPELRNDSQHALDAITRTVHRYQIAQTHFQEVIDGCRMDSTTSRYATWRSLERQCSLSGGASGIVLSCVLGGGHSGIRQWATQLGNAIRLTMILRDLKRDLARGRIYLPLEDLARFKVSQRELLDQSITPEFRELMKFEIARARSLYREGAEVICWLEGDGSRLMASTLVAWCSGLLNVIEKQDYNVFARVPRLTHRQKFARLSQGWQLSRRRGNAPLPDVFT